MRSIKLVALIALLASAMVYGNSRIVYSIRTGGDDHVATYEGGGEPAFTNTSTGVAIVHTDGADNLTWQVGVTVASSLHVGDPGNGVAPLGAANLVFDLEVRDAGGNLVGIGAAPISCTGGLPGSSTAVRNCLPTNAGFWSQINDGDADPSGVKLDKFANAALARGIGNLGGALNRNLQDAVAPLSGGADPGGGGPGFDYGWYPTAMGRGGLDFAGQKTIDTSSAAVWSTALAGKLVGFGAGYKSYDYANYRFGVGMGLFGYGFGAGNEDDPINPVSPERPLFEGQINAKGMTPGTYTLRVVPSQDGNNILHGLVAYDATAPSYGGFGTFAAKANEVGGVVGGTFVAYAEVPFIVKLPDIVTSVSARKVFYNNSYFDGNNASLNTGVSATNNHDDDNDAVDTNKSPLMPGAGTATFANWTGFAQGINGLIYEVTAPTRTPVAGDFTFKDMGKSGTVTGGASPVPNAFVTYDIAASPRVVRCVMSFTSTGGATPSGTVQNTWLQVTIGTGFGLGASEVHYWGNARMDDGSFSGVNILVNATDEVDARNNPRPLTNRAPVTWAQDYNKDGLCNSTDEVLARNNPATLTTCVKRTIK